MSTFKKLRKSLVREAALAASPVINRSFHYLYYCQPDRTWRRTWFAGTRVVKTPLDLWIYQEILSEIRPELIIETGTLEGGSALYLAFICEMLGVGQIVSIDIDTMKTRPSHNRINYLAGSSVDPVIVQQVYSYAEKVDRVLVILDSDHSADHVLREMRAYSSLVSLGSYLIVEDTNVNGHPVNRGHGPGPAEAAAEFLRTNSDFEVDSDREKFLLTFNPRGYLRRRAFTNGPEPLPNPVP